MVAAIGVSLGLMFASLLVLTLEVLTLSGALGDLTAEATLARYRPLDDPGQLLPHGLVNPPNSDASAAGFTQLDSRCICCKASGR